VACVVPGALSLHTVGYSLLTVATLLLRVVKIREVIFCMLIDLLLNVLKLVFTLCLDKKGTPK